MRQRDPTPVGGRLPVALRRQDVGWRERQRQPRGRQRVAERRLFLLELSDCKLSLLQGERRSVLQLVEERTLRS